MPLTDPDLHPSKEIQLLIEKLDHSDLPDELRHRMTLVMESLCRMTGSPGYSSEYEATRRYMDWVCDLPWNMRSKDNLDVLVAQERMDETHYGLTEIKERILEYIAIFNLRERETQRINGTTHTSGGEASFQESELKVSAIGRSPVLALTGLPGIGKTSLARSIAYAMSRKFVRIPMGGMGSASQLRGKARGQEGAEPGQIIKGLRRSNTKNPVILLDEIDRTAEVARAEIMGALLEILDPEQNNEFIDYYIDYPFDLSEVLFLVSCNNTGGISNAVLDRLEILQMPGYTDEEKIVIARDYLLPRQLRLAGLTTDTITFAEEVWPSIVRPLGFDAGIRTMERTINGVVGKIARRIISGQGEKFHLTSENISDFLPKW